MFNIEGKGRSSKSEPTNLNEFAINLTLKIPNGVNAPARVFQSAFHLREAALMIGREIGSDLS